MRKVEIMPKIAWGAFTLLVVVNGQDVETTCSVCGPVGRSTVDRRAAAEARMETHVARHIADIGLGLRAGIPPTPKPKRAGGF